MADVTIFENANFQGTSRTFGAGSFRFFDFSDMNDMTSSIRVAKGSVALVYEHADSQGGYGISADFMEDCQDLSQYGLNDKISYITIFEAEQPSGLIWVRNQVVDGQFEAGHWERKRADGTLPPNTGVVVSPPIPPHDIAQPVITSGGTLAVPDSATVKNHAISSFTAFASQTRWDSAIQEQMGILGNDYRGVEEIGSAAFERASNSDVIPDFLNFWYPQKQPNDHRSVVYFKRTLSGTVIGAHLADVSGTFADTDLNIDIEPSGKYRYLIDEGHPREYTDIMKDQYYGSLGISGESDCNDAQSLAEFTFVEAEVDFASNAKDWLVGMLVNHRLGAQLCVYGPWIYDKGHCCHPEIHPAEQIWWSVPSAGGQTHYCNVIADGSKRFWWRDQMDDGTKLKPWGAPPITGIFAIVFETEINAPAKQFTIIVYSAFNNITSVESFQRHHLVYGNNTLVAVAQDPTSLVKVSFEEVGLVGASTVRGFVVIEATVGKCTQHDNPIWITEFGTPVQINLPPNSDPNKVAQQIERAAFSKEGGHLLAIIVEGGYQSNVPYLDVVPEHLGFPNTALGEKSDGTVQVNNWGQVDLVVSTPASPPSSFFHWKELPPTSVAPGASLEIKIEFAPKASGEAQGRLSIYTNDDPLSPRTVTLQGATTKVVHPL